MTREQLLTTWTDLKTKLGKLVFLNKYKELIKDALQHYLHRSSSLLSTHSELYCLKEADPRNERAYRRQWEMNEQIVRECKELLEKLSEI